MMEDFNALAVQSPPWAFWLASFLTFGLARVMSGSLGFAIAITVVNPILLSLFSEVPLARPLIPAVAVTLPWMAVWAAVRIEWPRAAVDAALPPDADLRGRGTRG